MIPKVYQFLVALFAAFGSFLYGYDLGIIASVVASDSFADKFLTKQATTRSGTIVALFTAGGFFGAFGAGFCDPLGRRGTLLLGSALFLVGGILQTAAETVSMLYVGRLFAGFGIGILVEIVPQFQAEISHANIRGIVTSLQQTMLGIGSLAANWIGYGCFTHWANTGISAQWRLPLALQMVPAIGLGACIYLFPESPRWLIDHDRPEDGLHTLADLHANGNIHDPYVQAEYEIILSQIADEHQNAAKTYTELFRTRSNTRRIILACACQASAQMTGVSAIQYFSPAIFSQIGISAHQTLLYQGINSILGELAQAIFFFLIDRVGRRPLQIGGNLACGVAFIIGAALLATYPPTSPNTAAHWAFIVASTWLFNFCFCASGTMSWIIPAEIFNTATRVKGISLATMVSFAFNTMIGQVTPVALAAIGWRYYILFIVCDVTNALFFYFFLPETKGVTLEAMNDLFTNSPWVVPGSKWNPAMEVDVDRLAEIKQLGGGKGGLELEEVPVEADSFKDFHYYVEGHPVFELNYKELCEGSLEKVQKFREEFDPTSMEFKSNLLKAFQATNPSSSAYNLTLIELVAVACHQIAVYLFQLDDGSHKHSIHEKWANKQLNDSNYEQNRLDGLVIPPTAFYHNNYNYPERYPNGVADMAGYWAEAKIFGGVVLFDRGESGNERKGVFLHRTRTADPKTIYPPTTDQFEVLMKFLLSRPNFKLPSPLPIHATELNCWHYDPWDSMTRFHIFRDRYERKPPKAPRSTRCVQSSHDWPELQDKMFLITQSMAQSRGEPVDEAAVAEALERMKQITPSSPCWGNFEGDCT
ncbi:hypothetical protein B7463_g5661, partial [Scytalidium lignicola]